jgi:uncharacterized protein (TIGR00730 family)
MKRICVFCASSRGANPRFAEAARELGRALVERGIGLVYGGGNVGLMGIVADAVIERGGEAIGVIPQALVDRELAHRGLSALHVVRSMHERKRMMHDLSDGFVTLPGGIGTLEELMETLTWAALGLHQKPCGLVDVDGYYDPLLALLARAVEDRLLRVEHRAMLLAERTPSALLDRFLGWRAPTVEKWIDRDQT